MTQPMSLLRLYFTRTPHGSPRRLRYQLADGRLLGGTRTHWSRMTNFMHGTLRIPTIPRSQLCTSSWHTQQIAIERGGKCLSETYTNNRIKLRWECVEGHQWEATPHDVKRNHWCPECAGNTKGTLEEMHQIAEERGGKCLSDTYLNSRTKLLWECAEGHQWETAPDSIKGGTWCPKCAGKAKGTIEEMQQIALFIQKEALPFCIIGKGSNLLFDDQGFDGLVIHNKINFLSLSINQLI